MNNSFFYTPQGQILATLLAVWSAFWKILALWRAGKVDQKYWFLAIFIFNTIGILEIIYLFKFCKKILTWDELQSYFTKKQLKSYLPNKKPTTKKN